MQPALREVDGERARPADRFRELGFLLEQQAVDQRFGGLLDGSLGCGCGGVPGRGISGDGLIADIQGVTGFESGLRDEVHDFGLMLQHHQRDQIAVRGQVWLQIKPSVQVGDVQPVGVLDRLRLAGLGQCHIAEVFLIAVSSSDVPAAPALFQRARGGRYEASRSDNWLSLLVGHHRADKHSGNVLGSPRPMTVQAAVGFLPKRWWYRILLPHCVERHSQLGVGHCDLNQTVLHKPEMQVFVEVDRPWGLW